MGKPIGPGTIAFALRAVRHHAIQAAIERAGSKHAAAVALGVDRQVIRGWLSDSLAVPTGESEIAKAVRTERDRLVREAIGAADGYVQRAATALGVTRQTMKCWLVDIGMYHPTPSLCRTAGRKRLLHETPRTR